MSFTNSSRPEFLKKALSLIVGVVALASVALVASSFVEVPHALAIAGCKPGIDEGCDIQPPEPKACGNGEDDDGDGKADYKTDGTGDPGCASAIDNNENGSNQCDDGIDNDGDHKIDYQFNGTGDPQCTSILGNREQLPTRYLTVNIPAQEREYENYAKGQISVVPGGTCVDSTCTFPFVDGDVAQLTATALPTTAGGPSFFTGWLDDCSGTSANTSVQMVGGDKICTANFHRHGPPYPTTHTWVISNTGTGSGSMTYRTGGVDYTLALPAGKSYTIPVVDDQWINGIRAIADTGMNTSYPNPNESCFQDGNVFVQINRSCTVTFTPADPSMPPTCSFTPISPKPGDLITFTSTAGAGAYSWSAPGANPSTGGNSATFTASYTTTGPKAVTVTRGTSGSATCNLTVSTTPVTTGTINVVSNLATTFSATGPTPLANEALSANQTRSFTSQNASASGSNYTITPAPKAGYSVSVTPSASQTLYPGSAITYTITYTQITGISCSANPNPVATNTNTTFTVTNGTGPYTWNFPGGYYMFGPVTSSLTTYNVQYQNTGTYNASVTDSAGKTGSCSVVVGNGNPPVIPQDLTLDFFVSSAQNGIYGSQAAPTAITVAYGTNIVLEWSSHNVSPTGCVASGSWSGQKTANAAYSSETKTNLTAPPTPKIYTLRCYGFATTYGGSEPYIEKSITVNVSTTNKGTLTVSSNVPTTWSFTGSPTPPAAQTTPATAGSYVVDPGTYTISAPAVTGYTGPVITPGAAQTVAGGQTRTYTLTYTPVPGASVDLKANGSDTPAPIIKGTAASLAWATTNIQTASCVASSNPAGWSGAKGDSGAQQSQTISASTVFTLTCKRSSDGTNISDSVTVGVREKQCGDGIDNDGDGRIDGKDPGCGGGSGDDDDEGNAWNECEDGIDNSDPEDTRADANDPGCWTDPNNSSTYNPNDNDERDANTVIGACNDGLDNDGDGAIDGLDDGCTSGSDTSELKEPDIREI